FDIVNVPAGTFLVHNLPLRAGLTLAGGGEASVLRSKTGPGFALLCDSGSPDLASNVRGIVVRNLQLRGSCDTDGFEEHQHLASLNGVSDVTFHNVIFRGFRGDGLYVGSGWNSPKAERHNRNVLVRSCTFDGINHQNRNG